MKMKLKSKEKQKNKKTKKKKNMAGYAMHYYINLMENKFSIRCKRGIKINKRKKNAPLQ